MTDIQIPNTNDDLPDDFFEDLEEKLLDEVDKKDHKNMPVSGKSVFEIERLKRKRLEGKE